MPKRPKPARPMILGVGLDSDGHQRVTKGENFLLAGGSQSTHEEMTEKVVKLNEKLKQRGKALHEASREEMDDIAHEVGLHRHAPHRN